MTYEWAQLASVVNDIGLDMSTSDKHSILLDSFISYEENEVLSIQLYDNNFRIEY